MVTGTGALTAADGSVVEVVDVVDVVDETLALETDIVVVVADEEGVPVGTVDVP